MTTLIDGTTGTSIAGNGTVVGDLTVSGGDVILAGSTSGTATISAPAVAGSTAVTLPATTGTVALTSDVIGVNQTWQTLTGSRALGTTYTNSTGKPIMVSVRVSLATSSNNCSLNVDSVSAAFARNDNASNIFFTLQAIVPNGSSYVATANGGVLNTWTELR